jgi:hypothetical protein
MLVLLSLGACSATRVDRAMGAACDGNADCDQRCLLPSADYPGGFCTLSCNTTADCRHDDAVCVDDEGGVCLYVCENDGDCAFLSGDGTLWQCKTVDLKDGTPGLACRGD